MAVPEIIEWESIEGFKYSGQTVDDVFGDISIKECITTYPEDVTIEMLKSKQVFGIEAVRQEIKYNWTAYQCLYSEVKDRATGNTFLLTNSKWYQIEKDFGEIVEKNYSDLISSTTLSLPEYSHKNEGEYNDGVEKADSDYLSLDRKLIQYGGKYNKIEFCDLLSKDKKIIHVKHYGGSSVLSHLFSQGLVSGELMISDSNYRKKVLEKITKSEFKLIKEKQKPKADEFEIVFAIISTPNKALDIPFFSKVSLKNARRRLESFGYHVHLTKINSVELKSDSDKILLDAFKSISGPGPLIT